MKVLIDANIKCRMFRRILEHCSEEEKGRIGSLLDEEGAKNKKVHCLFLLLFYTKKDEIKEGIINDRAQRNCNEDNTTANGDGVVAEKPVKPRSDGTVCMSELAIELGRIIQNRNWTIDLTNDDYRDNATSSSIFGISLEHQIFNVPLNEGTNENAGKSNTYMYRDSLVDTMADIDDNDTIQARLNIFKEKLYKEIEKYYESLNDTQKEAFKNRLNNACEEEIGDTDVSTWLIDRSMTNLQGCCDKLLNIINKAEIEYNDNIGINFKTYYGIQLWLENRIISGATQMILTGAPGTGKTRMAKNIADQIGSSLPWEKDRNYKLVQFHPSYDYTDFVEGLRPVTVKIKRGDGQETDEITFKKMDGIFKRFCRWVAYQNKREGQENAGRYFFIIDEINRADLSKVFGELMYCLETDKRGENNPIETQYQNLDTYFEESLENSFKKVVSDSADISEEFQKFQDIFKEGFYIPKNVIVIGTMNDIDRSVESMDYALRRRFTWKEVEVNKDFLESAFRSMLPKEAEFDPEDLADRIMKLNEQLEAKEEYGLNKHYYISQGQFSGLLNEKWEEKTIEEFIREAWNNNIKLLITEYVRGEYGVEDFLNKCEAVLGISQMTETVHNDENIGE